MNSKALHCHPSLGRVREVCVPLLFKQNGGWTIRAPVRVRMSEFVQNQLICSEMRLGTVSKRGSAQFFSSSAGDLLIVRRRVVNLQ